MFDALTRFLDRPSAADSTDEETVTAFVISDLTDLRATGAYDTIARAFAEDRVDTQILDLAFVEAEWGMRPKPDYTALAPRQEPGVRLLLKCKVCGREREHIFPKVYCDLPTVKDEKKRKQYEPLIIPQRVTCPKCGAVDQYELGAMGQIAITAHLLAQRDPEIEGFLRPDQQIQFITFTTRWGPMHPVAAIERYERELARQPNDADLHVGYGNLRRFLGYYDKAQAEYERALAIDANNVEAWVGQAEMAGERRDHEAATRCWQEVRRLAAKRSATSNEYAAIAAIAEAGLAMLDRGLIPDIGSTLYDTPDEDPAPTVRPVPEWHIGLSPLIGKKSGATTPAPVAAARNTSTVTAANRPVVACDSDPFQSRCWCQAGAARFRDRRDTSSAPAHHQRTTSAPPAHCTSAFHLGSSLANSGLIVQSYIRASVTQRPSHS